MRRDDDDDPAIDWGPDAATSIDRHPPVPEADTAKFKSLEYAMGREAGFSEGIERVARAFQAEARRSGVDAAAIRRVVSAIRTGAIDLG